jgi:uncharacterized membrane protein (UPF0127 family)
VRFAALLTIIVACSTSAKREDGAPMPPSQNASGSGSGSQAAPAPAGPVPKVYLSSGSGEVAVTVEVVATEAKIEKGLMYRQHLPLDAGMLFMMGREHDWKFWMRNTLIPLDMIFIAKDMTVAGIVENAEPLTEEPLRGVGKPSLYVLEVNGGWSAKNSVAAGSKVRFEHVDTSLHP